MASNKNCFCKNGNIKLIDPNNFNGQSSTDRFSVPLEDLSIYVDLSVTKKSRSVITDDGSISKIDNVTNNKSRISFIDGSVIGEEKKSLTTKYTDNLTIFNKTTEVEGLGITDIDINFNPSLAPLITIKFIDVRGQALFNTGNQPNSPYKLFFELPYPIFDLTIKGYYGKPVRYCLHLTKFNSAFNSSTGNFEITANFIGYTYAMLTDLLLGYLRAVAETPFGIEYLENINKDIRSRGGEEIITINQLLERIQKLNEKVIKLKTDNKEVEELSKHEKVSELVDNIELLLNDTINKLTLDSGGNKISTSLFNDENEVIGIRVPTDKKVNDEILKNYKDSITSLLSDINNKLISDKPINYDIFRYDVEITLSGLISDKYKGIIDKELTTAEAKYKFKSDLTKLFQINRIPEDLPVYVYNIKKPKDSIKALRTRLADEKAKLTSNISNRLQILSENELGINPTIKSLFRILTTHAEMLLSCVKRVSTNAEALHKDIRLNELKKLRTDLDTPKQTSSDGTLNPVIYAWPEYKSKGPDNEYVESWLGKGISDNGGEPRNVDEINFVDDILRGLLKTANIDNVVLSSLNATQIKWAPINPLDTGLFNSGKSPYASNSIINGQYLETLKLVGLRAFIFLGYSNLSASKEEAIVMGKLEANNAFNENPNDTLKLRISSLNKNDILTSFNSEQISLMKLSNDKLYYEYNWIYPNSDIKYIPLTGDFKGDNFLNNTTDTFISNYTTNAYDSPIVNKTTSGETYVKFFQDAEYAKGTQLPDYVTTLTTDITKDANNGASLSELEKSNGKSDFDDKVGKLYPRIKTLSPFNGSYGVTEISKVIFDTSDTSNHSENNDSIAMIFFTNDKDSDSMNTSLANIRTDNDILENDIPNVNLYSEKIKKGNILDVPDGNYYRVNHGNFLTEDNKGHNNIGKNRELYNTNDVCIPYIVYNFNGTPISLFGSRFYFEQRFDVVRDGNNFGKDVEGKRKAFLFLHTLPWNLLFNDKAELKVNSPNETFFDNHVNTIRNLFAYKAAFVQAPKVWVAFIGGLLWRAKQNIEPLVFGKLNSNGSGYDEVYVGGYTSLSDIPIDSFPSKTQFLTTYESKSSLNIGFHFGVASYYKFIDNILLNLPSQVKDEFINIFETFSENEFLEIRRQLEIDPKNDDGTPIWVSSNDWVNQYEKVLDNLVYRPYFIKQQLNAKPNVTLFKNIAPLFPVYLSIDTMKYGVGLPNKFQNFDNYIRFEPITGGDNYADYNLEISEKSNVQSRLRQIFTDVIWIANSTYRIWLPDSESVKPLQLRNDIVARKDLFDEYINSFINEYKRLAAIPVNNKDKDLKQQVFNTMDNDTIRLNIYRHLKIINDKWIGGTGNNDIIFQCGRNVSDTTMANKNNRSEPKLIDSFRFINRAFKDIGDELLLNPFSFTKIFVKNYNQSLYDLIARTLADNNMDFFPLPSFINYNDANAMCSVFNVEPTNIALSKTVAGPSFICMYMGQVSNKLDLGKDSMFENDGFDLVCNGETSINKNGIPNDVSNGDITAFKINYGHQNQNIFTDIKLDQQQFSETDESLRITDDISKLGSPTNRREVGQNLFNVYQNRSYKADVTAMGNAMIQPMMYFQLNNIPMFHGAYLITKVSHNIKPNHMSTSFSGVRIKHTGTKLLDSDSLYMSILGSLSNVADTGLKIGTRSAADSKYGKFVTSAITENDGLKFTPGVGQNKYVIKEIAGFIEEAAILFHSAASNETFNDKILLTEASQYNGGQIKDANGKLVHVISSFHNIGLAVDIRPVSTSKEYNDPISLKYTATTKQYYSKEGTQLLLNTIIDLSKTKKWIDAGVRIKVIYFYDKIPLVRFDEHHDDHIHIEFDYIKRVEDELKKPETPGDFNPTI